MEVTDREVYDEIAPDLVRYATVLVGWDHAPGVVSSVVARALHRTGGLAGLDAPKAYLMRAVLDEATGVKWRRSHLLIHPMRAVDSGIPEVEVEVEVGNVDDLITELPILQRAAAWLVIYLQSSLTEAADVMGRRPSTVRRHLDLARKSLTALGDDRIKEVFRRITDHTPVAPAFATLDAGEIGPRTPIRVRPWMLATGATLLVLIVVGVFGILGGGVGSDLAAPDENTIDYVKLEYSGSAAPGCLRREVVDNFGHNEATIEIWGPNSDDLTLMVATFPDGSTERTVIEGGLENPVRGWGRDPTEYPYDTSFRVIGCEGTDSEELPLLEGFNLPDRGPIPPSWFLSPPGGGGTWDGVFGEAVPAELDGTPVLLYQLRRLTDDAVVAMDLYVTEDNKALLRQYTRTTYRGMGSAVIDVKVVEKSQVPAAAVSFDTSGLVAINYSRGFEFDREDCPVTIPTRSFTPPDGYPARPSDPDSVWFGKDEMWTVLSNDGTYVGPRRSVWWSVNFPDPGGVEFEPGISVTWTLRNSSIPVMISETGMNGSLMTKDGLVRTAGGDPSYSGCWEVTAIYEGASLSYVYYNPGGLDSSILGVVPDVVGMTVERAGNVLKDALYNASFHDSADPDYEVCTQEPGAGLEVDPGAIIGMRTAPPGACSAIMDPTVTSERCLEYLPPQEEFVVVVFFNCGDGEHPNLRPVGRGPARGRTPDAPIFPITYAMTHLLAGPTATERADGFDSSFSEQSVAGLLTVNLEDGHLILDFTEDVTVDNASTATGSTFFLAELYANSFQFEDVETVEFQINGSCEAFWEFLQAGPTCNITYRAGWEQIQEDW